MALALSALNPAESSHYYNSIASYVYYSPFTDPRQTLTWKALDEGELSKCFGHLRHYEESNNYILKKNEMIMNFQEN